MRVTGVGIQQRSGYFTYLRCYSSRWPAATLLVYFGETIEGTVAMAVHLLGLLFCPGLYRKVRSFASEVELKLPLSVATALDVMRPLRSSGDRAAKLWISNY